MARRPRQLDTAPFFHIINRGIDSHDLFAIDQDFRVFERRLADTLVASGARIHAYALMSNHFHLLVEPAGCPDLSQAVGQVQSRYAKAFNRRTERRGTLFDRRFLAFEVDGETEFHRVSRYIHANPIAISGRRGIEAYRWSSLPVYLGRRSSPDWLSTDVLGPEIQSDRYLSAVLGLESQRLLPAAVQESVAPVGLGVICAVVARRQLDHATARGLIAFLAREFRAADTLSVAGLMECSPSTVRRAASRCRDRLHHDGAFAGLVEGLLAEASLAARHAVDPAVVGGTVRQFPTPRLARSG